MNDEPMWAADRVVAPTPGSAITIPKTANEFAIKGNHLTLIKGNQFDGRTKTDPHKHIYEFLGICDMFKYRDTENEVVRLMMFPLSLTGEAKTCLDELNERTIETWDEHQNAFISRFFPPTLFDRLLEDPSHLSHMKKRTQSDAWLRIKEMLKNCHGNNLSKDNIIKIFYHGLNEVTQEVLNAAAGGIFLYKTPNQAYQLLEDKVLLKLDWAKKQKTKSSLKKTITFAAEDLLTSNLLDLLDLFPVALNLIRKCVGDKEEGGGDAGAEELRSSLEATAWSASKGRLSELIFSRCSVGGAVLDTGGQVSLVIGKMLQRCKEAHLVLNWEKCQLMIKEGIVLGHKTIVHADHSALRHLFKKQEAKPCLIRWILLLQEFDIEIKDRKGTKNVVADHLSQIENDETSDDSKVDDDIPGETLMEINTDNEPWFADFANYLASDIMPKGMTY
ncbi:reverse transcriptase domain-containing protein [Tanacetum coccineum]